MITVLSPQGDVRGTYENKVPNATPYFEDKLLDNLETEQTTLEFAVPLQSPDSEWLEGFSTVLYPDKDGVLRELTVINVWEDWNREEPLKRVVCEDSSVDILLKTHVVPFTAGSLEEAIRGALMASPWEYVIGEDTANIGYYLVDVKEYTDVRSVLETIKQTYGIEYRFSARFDGRKLTRVLNVAKRFGADTGKYFIYDRDLVNIERTIDYDNIHTSVITYWQEDDVMRTLAGYNPVNKIAGFRKDIASDQIYHNEAHSQYDSDDYGKVLIMKSSSTDPELSYLEACNKLLDYIAPTYTYNVNVHILENALGFEGTEQIHLGDTVWLKEKVGDMELGLSARVIQLITSHTNPEEDEVTFTNFKEIDVADSAEVNALRNMIQQIQEQQDSITQTVVQVTENITQLQQGQEGIIVSLDGKSSISVGATPNPNPKNGDTWFTDVLDPATGKTYSTTKVWVETTQQWETKYSAKDAEEALAAANEAAQAGADAKAAADAAKDAADDATAAGEAASQKADQAAADAAAAKASADAIKVDVGKLQTDVGNVQIDVGKAQTDASKALTDSASAITKVGQVDSKVTTVTNDVNGMKTTISDIQTTQGETTQKLTEVTEDVDGLTVTVGQVKTTADGALSKATTVETTVNGLKTTVGEVKTTADGAMSKATQVEQTAEGLTTTVATIQTDIGDLTNRFPDYNFKKQTPNPVLPTGVTATYDTGGVVISNTTTARTNIYWGSLLVAGKTYNVKAYVNVDANSLNKEFEFGSAGGDNIKFTAPNNTNPVWITGTMKQTTAGTAFQLYLPASSTIRLRELYIYEANTNITSSQITQLSDNINLKVDKNGVIAQINVSSEGVLIDGKNIWITGLTKIDNAVIKTAAIADLAVTTAKIANLAVGTAQIGAAAITEAKIGDLAVTTAKIANLAVTDAKIGSLSANKITTGTLDAGVISVINLNASNIKSGTLSGLRIESPYDVPVASGATTNRRGSLVMVDGYFRNVWQTYVVSSGSVTANGELTLNHEALTSVERTGASTTVADRSMQLTAYGLTLQNSAGQGGTLSFQDLFSLGSTSIPAQGTNFVQYNTDPSSANHPTAIRFGRVVQLTGAFKNVNLIASGVENWIMGTLPVGFRPQSDANFICQGTGANIYMMTVQPGGQIRFGRYRGDTGSTNNYKFDYKDCGAGSWLNIACVYAAANV